VSVSGRRRLASAIVVALMAGCSTPPIVPGVPKVVSQQAIAPYESHTECLDLAPGDRLDYRFATSVPVAFNIHYREGRAYVMPITRDGVTSDAGIFAPRIVENYCLMWEAGANAALLDYRIVLRRVPP